MGKVGVWGKMPAYSGCRVLVVEDETWVAMDIEAMLADLGCTAIGPAATIPDALRLIATQPLDAALLDINVNGSMSYEVADTLKLRGIPFLILTGHEHDFLPDRFRRSAFLRKPYSGADLLRQLAIILPDERYSRNLMLSVS